MFAKLLKHEWKATSRLLGILSLCALGVGPMAGFTLRTIIRFSEKVVADSVAILVVMGFGLLLLGLFLALIVYAVGTEFYLLFRFYKTRFTDQGYLAFTLPVSNRGILLSSYMNMLLWMLISVITVLISVVIAVAIGLAGNVDGGDLQAGLKFYGDALKAYDMDGYVVLQIVGILVSVAANVMILMGSVTVGAVIAKKHKILAAIGIYYGQSLVMSILASVIQLAASLTMMNGSSFTTEYVWVTGLTYILQAVWGLGAYFLSLHLINKKLNLP